MEKKWFDIAGSIEVDNVTEEELNNEFLKWIEEKGWTFAGVIKANGRITAKTKGR